VIILSSEVESAGKSGGLPSNKRSHDTGTTLKCGQKRTNVQPGLSLPSRPD
jgi:hypothetical protein